MIFSSLGSITTVGSAKLSGAGMLPMAALFRGRGWLLCMTGVVSVLADTSLLRSSSTSSYQLVRLSPMVTLSSLLIFWLCPCSPTLRSPTTLLVAAFLAKLYPSITAWASSMHWPGATFIMASHPYWKSETI